MIKMKKEMVMMPNGNYEEIFSPIQHQCKSNDEIIECVEYGWKIGKLILKIEGGNDYENGYATEIEMNYCPFCGYHPLTNK